MVRLDSSSVVVFVAVLAFGAGWWAGTQRGVGESTELADASPEATAADAVQSGSRHPGLSSVAGDRSRVAPKESAPDPEAPTESAAEDAASPSFDPEFFRSLEGPERDAFLAEHRWEYIQGHHDAVVKALDRLEHLQDPQERFDEAAFLLQTSIALSLDVQNRAVAWEPGEPVNSNWVYRVHVDEFPEIAYFHAGQARDVDPATGVVTFAHMDPQYLALVHQRASTALDMYGLSKPDLDD